MRSKFHGVESDISEPLSIERVARRLRAGVVEVLVGVAGDALGVVPGAWKIAGSMVPPPVKALLGPAQYWMRMARAIAN